MFAFVFPGQGSQYVGMLDDYSSHSQVRLALEEVAEAVKTDLVAMCSADGREELLNDTSNTQPALVGMSVGIFRAWFAESGARPAILAGHSLGEYSALVCAQSIDLVDAAVLARVRGDTMKSALPPDRSFGMYAVIGLEVDKVCSLCDEHEGVYAVNLNSPIQTVVGGEQGALEQAVENLRTAGAKRVVPLKVSVPSHCPWLEPAVQPFGERLKQTPVRIPEIPVIQNSTLEPAGAPEAIREALKRQLVSPVDWIRTVMKLYSTADTFIECGPGQVLTGLNRRIAKRVESHAMANSEQIKDLASR